MTLGRRQGGPVAEEKSMRGVLLTMFAAAVLIAAGSVASSAGRTDASGHHRRGVGHQDSVITGFSSSALHVGVNRPPKNR
jgi:hypothetical protein